MNASHKELTLMQETTDNTASAYAIASAFHWEKLVKTLQDDNLNIYQPGKELLLAQPNQEQACNEFIVFEYGCVIFFNASISYKEKIIKKLLYHAKTRFRQFEKESFTLNVNASKSSIKGSELTIKANSDDDKIAVAYAIAQSVKLSHYESSAEKILDGLRNENTELAKYGRILIGRSSALKKTGQIFSLKAQINLHSDLLDTPDFFWDRHEAEKIFLASKAELDMQKRLENLNKRLDMMQELYEMLAEQIKHGHYTMLEITIVILISIEVVYTLRHWLGYP